MLVTCPACSARFQLPDERIAGRRARMKCKRCDSHIIIDGTSISVSESPVQEQVAPLAETPLAKTRQEALLEGQHGKADDHPALPSEDESRSGPPRERLPSFSDETVALGKEEAAALSRQTLQEENPSQDAKAGPFNGDRITPVSSPVTHDPPAGPPNQGNEPGDAHEGTEDETTRSYDVSVAWKPAPQEGSRAEDDEATKMFAPASSSEEDEATTMFTQDAEGEAPLSTSDEEPTRVFDEETEQSSSSGSSSVSGESAGSAPGAPGQPSLPAPELWRQPPPPTFPTGTYTAQQQSLPSGTSAPGRSSWGIYLFFVSTTILIALTALFLARRDLFEQGVTKARQALGIVEPESAPSGPPFDTLAAGDKLSQIARKIGQCQEPDGPTGAGRVRVLFQPSGQATSAAVSPPFHNTTTGACLVEQFKKTQVPPFGGQPVIVTKTFQLPPP